jgi:NADH-quinone oxidoreductase subunit J
MQVVLFYMFGGLALFGALGVVLSRNIIRAAVQLLLALLGVAGLYFLLYAEFLAAVQLVIYVGGTLVLIIFGVMLTSRSGVRTLQPKPLERLFAISTTILLSGALILMFLTTRWRSDVSSSVEVYPVRRLGEAFLGDYLLAFELASLLLLGVMIGAAYLAKRRQQNKGGT